MAALPDDFPAPVLLVQLIAGMTPEPNGDQSQVGYSHGTGITDTSLDADATSSRVAVSIDHVIAAPEATTAHMTDATETVYLAFTAGSASGTEAAAARVQTIGMVTGHPFFYVWGNAEDEDCVWLHAAITLGDTPPSITDGGGFTWTQLHQQALDGGYLTVWSAPVQHILGARQLVTVSERIDASAGLLLRIHGT